MRQTQFISVAISLKKSGFVCFKPGFVLVRCLTKTLRRKEDQRGINCLLPFDVIQIVSKNIKKNGTAPSILRTINLESKGFHFTKPTMYDYRYPNRQSSTGDIYLYEIVLFMMLSRWRMFSDTLC